MPERRDAGDVLQRLAGSTAVDQRRQSRSIRLGHDVAADHRGLDSAAGHAEHMRCEQFRVDGRVDDADLAQALRDAAEKGCKRSV
ncbi:hypothetical protein GCM10017596_25340 [Microbacterium keratanolyticum]|uniref:Uncharacterized protein n=1 Tax=Microbacterium keratanolyticum TaxID=67574 RepID=A0A9W6HUF4_9MICO|nr:hypothetical protein GCM10017596_25340 [Microbacterium keratanolyticum]